MILTHHVALVSKNVIGRRDWTSLHRITVVAFYEHDGKMPGSLKRIRDSPVIKMAG